MSNEKEINKLYDALDIIAKYEAGDSSYLKRQIRDKIAQLEIEDEKEWNKNKK
jgi:hypothetical protein